MSGVWTALVTPFDKKGHIDFTAYRTLLRRQRDARVAGVIPCGTTGEAPTLSTSEKKDLILCALAELKGSGVQIFAGTGNNQTYGTVEFSGWASDAGVDGVLVVTPYYNKPSQAGLIAHYRAVADAVKVPVMMYQVPGRTGVRMSIDTILTLAKNPRLAGLKDSTGDMSGVADLAAALSAQSSTFQLLCGDDPLFVPYLSLGAVGIVSVASNIVPEALVKIHSEWSKDKVASARALQLQFQKFFQGLFMEPNPAPAKQCLEWMKLCRSDVRLPLVPMTEANLATWKAIVKTTPGVKT